MQQRPTYVEADLAATPLSAALAGTGFDAARPAVFMCEGLLYYLPSAAADALLADWATIATAGTPCRVMDLQFSVEMLPCSRSSVTRRVPITVVCIQMLWSPLRGQL